MCFIFDMNVQFFNGFLSFTLLCGAYNSPHIQTPLQLCMLKTISNLRLSMNLIEYHISNVVPEQNTSQISS